jgi:predicted lipid-binding transport protein (Tim44 family)
MRRSMLAVAALTLAALLALQAGEAFARAGSGGSRGSRSSSAPAQPTSPSSPSRSLSTPASPASPAPPPSRGGWFGPIMGGLAGFALGGLLGSMLFGGGFGGGIGLLEILLIGAGLFLLFRFMSSRRQQQPTYATAGAPYAGGGAYAGGSAYGGGAPQETATPEAPAVASDLDRGLGHIRSMDPTFDPGFVADAARGLFGDVQRALTARDMSPVSGRLTSRMYTELTEQCDRLRAARQTNRMEAMNLRTADVTEAWQESGQDFVTVYLAGSLVDYTVDDATGAVVAGAKAPQEFEEFWTFTRPVGPNPWRLSAIQSS